MVYNNLGISGCKEFLTWFTLRTILKKDIQCQRNSAIILIQADLLSQNQIKILYYLRNTKCKQHEDHIYTIHNTYTYIVVDSNDTCQYSKHQKVYRSNSIPGGHFIQSSLSTLTRFVNAVYFTLFLHNNVFFSYKLKERKT